MPREAPAGNHRRVASCDVVHSQVQGHHAVSAGHVGQDLRIIASFRIGLAIPCKALASNRRRVALTYSNNS